MCLSGLSMLYVVWEIFKKNVIICLCMYFEISILYIVVNWIIECLDFSSKNLDCVYWRVNVIGELFFGYILCFDW